MPLIDRLGMAMGSKPSAADGLRWAVCRRSWLRRTTNPGATAPAEEEG